MKSMLSPKSLSCRRRWLALAFCLIVVGVRCISGGAAPSQSEVIAEAKAAIGRGDTRFVTVRGFTIEVPGIADGNVNSLVTLHGQRSPIGVGDFIRSAREGQEQQDAVSYAQTYNLYLLKTLLAHPDGKTKAYLEKVRQELGRLSKTDTLRSFKGTPTFLLISGVRESGYPIDDSRTSHVDTRVLLMNEAVLQGAERKLFTQVVKTYFVPYNRSLYELLKRRWAKQGIKDGTQMP